jgi:putative protease
MQLSFSRGFSHGFLDGNNHKVLVRGDYAKKRGILLGTVEAITRGGVRLRTMAPVKPGDGLVFDGDESRGIEEQGGRIYEVERVGASDRSTAEQPVERNELVELGFGRGSIDPRRLVTGQRVWKTDDPELTKRLKKSYQGPPARKVELSVSVTAETGKLLTITGKTATGIEVTVSSTEPLALAQSSQADSTLVAEQIGRMGGTIYNPTHISAHVTGAPMVPKSLLNQLRRELVAKLDLAAAQVPARKVAIEPALPGLLAAISVERDRQIAASHDEQTSGVQLSVLCRTTQQIETAAALGIKTIYADYQDIKKYGEAVAAAHRQGATIYIASPRIEKPGEANLFGFLAKQQPDGLLARNAGGLAFCARKGVPFVADFSLNPANALTVDLLKARGALRVTASYDLNVDQLLALVASTPPDWLEIVIHQQVPMFHMEHCVFCAFLSPGTDKTNCGRPCDVHDVKLRDRVGAEHPLTADVGCRNTLFNATPQTAAEYLPRFLASGARQFRIEFLHENAAAVERVIGLYREVLESRRDAKKLFRELNATGQYGVTRGPLAIL